MQDTALHEEALRLASTIVDHDTKEAQTRAAGDNVRRLNRLTLGAFIYEHPDEAKDLVRFLADKTPLTKGQIKDYVTVARWNSESGYGDFLRNEASLSFTINRTLAGIRTNVREGARPATVQERIDALQASIERNGGIAKEDTAFRDALHILPPPNSVDNIVELAKESPAFRQEIRDKGVIVLNYDDDRPERRFVGSRIERNTWDVLLGEMRSATRHVRDEAFEDDDTPQRVATEVAESAKDLQAVLDLLQGRLAFEQEVR